MTGAATFPEPEAIASGAATGFHSWGRAPGARPAPALRAAGASHPPGRAPTVRHRPVRVAPPLACACASANRTGGQSTGLSAFRSGTGGAR